LLEDFATSQQIDYIVVAILVVAVKVVEFVPAADFELVEQFKQEQIVEN
jgi:hypothetical protein